MEELLPCPFCGGKAKLEGDVTEFVRQPIAWYVQCTKCYSRTIRLRSSQKHVIRKWNSRPTKHALDGRKRGAKSKSLNGKGGSKAARQ